MTTMQWTYRCQEEDDHEYDQEKERQAYIEEPDDEDSGEDEEMDEM